MTETTKLNDGGPAFPAPARFDTEADSWDCDPHFTGMTLRDYFAARAMPMAVERLRHNYTIDMDDWYWTDDDFDAVADHSYRLADAMLRARQENSNG